MKQDTQPDHISKKVVVYRAPAMDGVKVRRDVRYSVTDQGALTMDIYYPPDSQNEVLLPAVIIVNGYPDAGFQKIVGCKFKEMGSSISWGQLIAASGVIAISYTNLEPAVDLHALLQYVRRHSSLLGIDSNKLGVLATSGHVPLALSVLMSEAVEYMKCAVLCYGYMLDLDGFSHVAEAARTWGFVNPCAGRSVEEISPNLPLFIVRAGQDQMPHLNDALDRFMTKALTCNLPVTFVNHYTAPHAFDLLYDSDASREIIKQILVFMRTHLVVAPL